MPRIKHENMTREQVARFSMHNSLPDKQTACIDCLDILYRHVSTYRFDLMLGHLATYLCRHGANSLMLGIIGLKL